MWEKSLTMYITILSQWVSFLFSKRGNPKVQIGTTTPHLWDSLSPPHFHSKYRQQLKNSVATFAGTPQRWGRHCFSSYTNGRSSTVHNPQSHRQVYILGLHGSRVPGGIFVMFSHFHTILRTPEVDWITTLSKLKISTLYSSQLSSIFSKRTTRICPQRTVTYDRMRFK